MSVAIIDYGMCNLGSVCRAFEECGTHAYLTDNPAELDRADHLILPGVGAFTQGMENLRSRGWIAALNRNVIHEKKPLLGICLGMQLLAEFGFEGGETKGLGFVAGSVERFKSSDSKIRIPHVGWNEVHYSGRSSLFEEIPSGTDFYFVHSYHLILKDPKNAMTTTPYCGGFVSSVRRENIYGVQFHPEKSQKPGFQLIRNFLKIC